VAEVNGRLRRGELGGVGWEGDSVVAPIKPAGDYYEAEDFHQDYLARGGRFGMKQSAAKLCTDKIRCYG
jgi:peptide-methionine (S)-S-oxide reductase